MENGSVSVERQCELLEIARSSPCCVPHPRRHGLEAENRERAMRVMLFVGYDAEVTQHTRDALSIYSFVFLLSGVSIFGSAFFTALNNGLVSAAISFLRTLV